MDVYVMNNVCVQKFEMLLKNLTKSEESSPTAVTIPDMKNHIKILQNHNLTQSFAHTTACNVLGHNELPYCSNLFSLSSNTFSGGMAIKGTDKTSQAILDKIGYLDPHILHQPKTSISSSYGSKGSCR
ncbi:crotonobetainyl-CoA:carnitine CoA-transferase [Striga asiatica]|uniref:Crotonobetainyl-CoA:carnitine CoA-transferase n=1 Tax=Striga asiatica TaxID=4170 RepID=A0A5A7P3X6_STRAF|nr:crotonobetainyl-CoA:carnitine CoA-transferase [Striga asiatica]